MLNINSIHWWDFMHTVYVILVSLWKTTTRFLFQEPMMITRDKMPNFIKSPSPPKATEGAMKTRSRKAGAADMVEGARVGTAMPSPSKPKDVLTPKRKR